ncbi:hypothetical protein E3E31_08515 [Thermococcus sp. M39]|uniref:hypothetical protein n=1 Tax=Thermococcus sp. M39 TaxID=1638262 RepID=UPI00143A60AC|nr:hypothetical protein [Thermococcus sp. M39]NJE08562.1 hypothetical protein [Thermococcus sp. M39]
MANLMPRVSVYRDLEKFREKVWERTKKLEALLEQDTEQLRKEINSTLGCGPDLYFYQKTVSLTKHASSREIETLLLDDQFIELLYATLTSWGMHSRGARMKDFYEFSQNIRKNISLFTQLAGCHLENGLNDNIVKPLLELFSSLDIMRSRKKANKEASKLVANSKLMHFILPNLVMPIDRTHTVEFFKGCGRVRLPPHMPENWHRLDEENKSDVRTFFRIHQTVSEIIQKQRILTKLQALIDNEWNQTIPKAIDNLIIYCKKHPEKCNRKR